MLAGGWRAARAERRMSLKTDRRNDPIEDRNSRGTGQAAPAGREGVPGDPAETGTLTGEEREHGAQTLFWGKIVTFFPSVKDLESGQSVTPEQAESERVCASRTSGWKSKRKSGNIQAARERSRPGPREAPPSRLTGNPRPTESGPVRSRDRERRSDRNTQPAKCSSNNATLQSRLLAREGENQPSTNRHAHGALRAEGPGAWPRRCRGIGPRGD